MDLRNASVIGYFSLPGRWLAEHNPAAYAEAMRDVPAGAGTCAHCGMALVNHVIVLDAEGVQRFIGQKCAERVGIDPETVRLRLTTEQLAARNAKRQAWLDRQAAWEAEREEARRVRRAIQRERVGDLLDLLCATGDDFHASLAAQLADGALTDRQAYYVAKATSATGRRNKKNAEAWDSVLARCTTKPEEEEAE